MALVALLVPGATLCRAEWVDQPGDPVCLQEELQVMDVACLVLNSLPSSRSAISVTWMQAKNIPESVVS